MERGPRAATPAAVDKKVRFNSALQSKIEVPGSEENRARRGGRRAAAVIFCRARSYRHCVRDRGEPCSTRAKDLPPGGPYHEPIPEQQRRNRLVRHRYRSMRGCREADPPPRSWRCGITS